MRRYATIAIAATMLSACQPYEERECNSATRTGQDFQNCMKDSYKAQYDAHRKVVKEYMAKS